MVSCERLHRLTIPLILSLSMLVHPPAWAGQQAATAQVARAGAVASVQAEGTAAHLVGIEGYIEGLMDAYLTSHEVAGAVVSLVENGEVRFAKGYGFADVERGIPVDARSTLFRPGSVGKLFTWTALMQQVELGKVDLDADINTYLDFKIPPAFGEPIRVRHLLAHNAGFAESIDGMQVRTPAEFVPLGLWLQSHIPARVRKPGAEASYSNYGATLAGYIVERTSGEPFADYIERHIFKPLGMTDSTFREPLSPAAKDRLAKGYRLSDGRFKEAPFELVQNIMPAGSITTTAKDMALFMITHLQDGRYGVTRILKPETARMMRSRLHANAPTLPGMAHGMMELRTTGPRIVGHGGSTANYSSYLVLAPAADVGFFVSMTGGPRNSAARSELVALLIERIFPAGPAPLWSGPPAVVQEGAYLINRRPATDRPPDLAGAIKVSTPAPLQVVTEIRGEKVAWEQIGPRLYRQVTASTPLGPLSRLEFHGEGQDTRFSFETQPHVQYEFVAAKAPAGRSN